MDRVYPPGLHFHRAKDVQMYADFSGCSPSVRLLPDVFLTASRIRIYERASAESFDHSFPRQPSQRWTVLALVDSSFARTLFCRSSFRKYTPDYIIFPAGCQMCASPGQRRRPRSRALAAGGLEMPVKFSLRTYIRSGASMPIRYSALRSRSRVARVSRMRALRAPRSSTMTLCS